MHRNLYRSQFARIALVNTSIFRVRYTHYAKFSMDISVFIYASDIYLQPLGLIICPIRSSTRKNVDQL